MRARGLLAGVAALAVLIALVVGVGGCGSLAKLDYRRLWSRASWQHPDRLIETLAIAPGATVADLGAGEGYFVPHLSRAVGPAGRVFAVEVDPERLADLRELTAEPGHANVTVVEGGASDPSLPDGAVDVALVVNVYHHLDDPVAYFRGLLDDLSTEGGRVAIVEPSLGGLGSLFVPGGHATSLARLRDQMGEAGYRLVESHDFLPIQSFAVFAPDAAAGGG